MIGLICPSLFEYRALRLLKFPKKEVSLCVSGMGKVRASHACHSLRYHHQSLEGILLVGFAGGLTPDLKIGDTIEPTIFIEHDYDARPFERYPNVIKKSGPRTPGVRLLKDALDVAILTQDRFLKENPYQADSVLPGKKKHLACDMESYAVAYFCENSKTKYSVVKLISDVADEHADHDFLKACRVLAPKFRDTVQEVLRRMQS